MTEEVQGVLLFNTQIAVALRGVRTALAWTQQDLATRAKVSKPTIARIESLDISPRGDTIHALLSAFRQEGVEIDMLADEVIVRFTKPALLHAQGNLST